MKIRVTKHDSFYMADCLDLPGSPPIGRGMTPEAALVELFFSIVCCSTRGGVARTEEERWTRFIHYDKGYGVEVSNYQPQMILPAQLQAIQASNLPDPDEQVAMVVLKALEEKKWLRPSSSGEDDRSESVMEIVMRALSTVRARNTTPEAIKRAADIIFQCFQEIEEVTKEKLEEMLNQYFNRPWWGEQVAFAQPVAPPPTVIGSSPNTPDDPKPTDARSQALEILRHCLDGHDGTWANVMDAVHGSTRDQIQAVLDLAAREDKSGKMFPTEVPTPAFLKDLVESDALQDDAQAIIQEVKQLSTTYVQDNSFLHGRPDAPLLIENAMLLGASVALRRQQSQLLAKVQAIAEKPTKRMDVSGSPEQVDHAVGPVKADSGIADQGLREQRAPRSVVDEHGMTWVEKDDQVRPSAKSDSGSKPIDFAGINKGDTVMSPYGNDEVTVEIIHISSYGVTFNHPVRGGQHLGFAEMSASARHQLLTKVK